MRALVPITVTDSVLVSTTIAEPAAGETAWVSAGTYAVGDLRIRTATHRVYQCIQAHTGRTTAPESDPLYWKDVRPTARFAPFDAYTSTKASAATSLSYTLKPGFVNAVDLYGLQGDTMTLTVRQGLGGAVLFTESRSLFGPAPGLFEYLFAPSRPIDRVRFADLPIHPDAHITIDVAGSTAAVGIIAVGQQRRLVEPSDGGVERGATVEPVTTSYIKVDETFGDLTIVRRPATTSMRVSVALPISDASYALRTVQELLDVPASWTGVEGTAFDGLQVFGLGSGSLSYDTAVTTKFNLTIKGLI